VAGSDFFNESVSAMLVEGFFDALADFERADDCRRSSRIAARC
jgi:hypothetical protein